MRYILICLAAFMLFAIPAFAGTTADVVVNIGDIDSLVVTGAATFTATAAILGGAPAYAAENGAGGAIQVNGYANYPWDLDATYGAFDDADWGLYLDDSLAGTNYVLIAPAGTKLMNEGAATGDITILYNAKLTGLDWANNAGDTATLTFTMSKD